MNRKKEGAIGQKLFVERRCEEFYFLRDRLQKYYGNLLQCCNLPHRNGPVYNNGCRIFMEINRAEFDRFLKQLIKQVRTLVHN